MENHRFHDELRRSSSAKRFAHRRRKRVRLHNKLIQPVRTDHSVSDDSMSMQDKYKPTGRVYTTGFHRSKVLTILSAYLLLILVGATQIYFSSFSHALGSIVNTVSSLSGQPLNSGAPLARAPLPADAAGIGEDQLPEDALVVLHPKRNHHSPTSSTRKPTTLSRIPKANFKILTEEGGDGGIIYLDGKKINSRSNVPIQPGLHRLEVRRAQHILAYAEINGKYHSAEHELIEATFSSSDSLVHVVFFMEKQ